MAAQTNPKAKMTPKMRYVHSNRISDTFSGVRDETLAEKVEARRGLVGMLRQDSPAGGSVAVLQRLAKALRVPVTELG
jgi:hypothetical protein